MFVMVKPYMSSTDKGLEIITKTKIYNVLVQGRMFCVKTLEIKSSEMEYSIDI